MIFAFDFQLNIERLTKPAAEAKKSVDAVTSSLRSMQKATESAEHAAGRAGPRLTKGLGGARAAQEASASSRKIADEWQRLAAKAEREEAKITRAREREAAKRTAIAERESKAQERMWSRIAFAAQRAQDRAAERAAHKPWFGGHKSVMDLLSARATAKVSGMATGAADFALGLPGMALGGIGGLALGGIKMAAGAALDLVSYSADAATNFAKMAISAQALREQSVAGFTSIYGNAGVADQLFEQAVRIAKLTKFDTPEVVQRFNDLAAGGFSAKQLPMMFAAIADVQSARGENYGIRYSTAVQKLNAQPSALFTTFQQAAMAGPGLKLAEEVLAQRLGLKSNNIDADLRKMFREKKISGGGAINAILEATSQRYDQGGQLGGFARQQGEGTWEGLISNIRNGLQDVMTMKLPDGHPMLRFKGILREINSLFDEQTQRGQRFQTLMSKLVEDVFLVFDIDPEKAGYAVENLIVLAGALEEKLRSVALWLRDNITRPLADGLSGEVGAGLGMKLKSGFIDLGITLGKAVAVGMFDALGLSGKARAIEKALKGENVLALPAPDKSPAQVQTEQYDAARNQTRATLGQPAIKSASEWDTGGWQIRGAGAEQTANAMGLPKFARGGRVDVPTIALVGDRGPEIIEPEGQRRGVVIHGDVVIQMPPGSTTGHTEQDAQRLGTALMAWLRQQPA